MKKYIKVFFAVILSFFLASCSQPETSANNTVKGLLVDTNVDVISSRGIGIDEFETGLDEVDFRFHNGDVVS